MVSRGSSYAVEVAQWGARDRSWRALERRVPILGSRMGSMTDAMESCGNRRPRVERLVSAWNQGNSGYPEAAGIVDDPLIGTAKEPSKRSRIRLTDNEVDAMRTARDQGISVNAIARRFGAHHGTGWAKTR